MLNDATRQVSALLLVAALAGCAAGGGGPCGGKVHPSGLGDDAQDILETAMADSRDFCSAAGAGCDFTVAESPQGWSVAATRTFPVDGKCASRIGDERFYSYDHAGSLVRVTEGM